jgi:hypothetical protein
LGVVLEALGVSPCLSTEAKGVSTLAKVERRAKAVPVTTMAIIVVKEAATGVSPWRRAAAKPPITTKAVSPKPATQERTCGLFSE